MASETETNKPRIGIYNSRAVALAYGRSKAHNQSIATLVADANKAKASGDTNKLQALKKEGASRQDRLHRQVFGDAPIDDILDGALKPALPEIQKKANVTKLLSTAPKDATVETVDVTAAMVDFFEPTPETRKMIEDLAKHPPLKPSQFPLKD
jgi:hypothetical protein